MMMFNSLHHFVYKQPFSIAAFVFLLLIVGCTPGTELLNRVPVHSVSFKVSDQNGDPIRAASVQASNGKSTPTDSTGMATLRFGTVGIYNVTVEAAGYLPTTMTVTLPADNKEVKSARLAPQVNYSTGMGFAQMSGAQLYPMLFTYLFNSFGYNMELTEYKPGQWTKWKLVTGNEDDTLIMKKAFLKENNKGQQWWQIQLFGDDGETKSYTAEVLFDTNKSSIRRYREKIGDQEPQEKPVTENWYSQPSRLTQESIEGAVQQEDVQIEVPKGSFSTDLINYGVGPELHLKIWRALDVPGGTVQYATEEDGELVYQSQLMDYGSDANTVLDSF